MRRRIDVVGNRITNWPLLILIAAALVSTASAADSPVILAQELVFYASFDEVTNANRSIDGGSIHTAGTIARESVREGNHRHDVTIVEGAGRFGGALRFADVSNQLLLYQGINVEYRDRDWSGTVSFWLKLDPNKDLKPGFCDPIQITDKKWNDAAMWVDFDKELPRDCRLGMFPNYPTWNADDTPYAEIPSARRPWIPVENPPFDSTQWTHVAWTFENVNSGDEGEATVVFYLNGDSQGRLKRPLRFDWDPEKVAIMLGINYIGDFDDLAIFNRALSAAEIRQLGRSPASVVLQSHDGS